jgi:hypothetical protein
MQSLIISILTLTSVATWAQSASAPRRDTPLLYANEVLELTVDQQDEYLAALRDFVEANQAGDPSFTQYLFDIFLDSSAAQAEDLIDIQARCEGNKIIDYNCMRYFTPALSQGKLGVCDPYNPKLGIVRCNNNGRVTDYQVNLETFPRSVRGKNQLAIDSAIRMGNTQIRADGPLPTNPNYKYTTENDEKTFPVRQRSGDGPTEASAPAPIGDARCFYGGFMIEAKKIKGKDGKETPNRCAPVRDLCAKEDPNMPIFPKVDDAFKGSICGKDPKNGKCPNGDQSSIRSNSPGNSEVVVCNPLLYGTKDNSAVYCVRQSKDASKECREKAKDNKNVKEILKKNPEAFNSMIRALDKQCGYQYLYSKKAGKREVVDTTAWHDTKDKAAFEKRQSELANRGGWATTAGKEDMMRTCKVLLDRAIEIAQGNAVLEKMVDSLAPEGTK